MENFVLYDEITKKDGLTIYKGRRKGTINFIAICCVDKNYRVEFTNHVRFAHEFNHAHIVRFHEWYETGNHLWLIVELCPGGNLQQVLQQDVRLPEPTLRTFGQQLVRALACLHQNDVLFADWSPQKIYLDGQNSLKLFDFTMARKVNEQLEEIFLQFMSAMEVDRDPIASIHIPAELCAPEIVVGHVEQKLSANESGGAESPAERLLDRATDMWGLGCLFAHMYTGCNPFTSGLIGKETDHYEQICHRILHDVPSFTLQNLSSGSVLPKTPNFSISRCSDWEDLVLSMLVKQPSKRCTLLQLAGHPFWRGELSDLVGQLNAGRIEPQISTSLISTSNSTTTQRTDSHCRAGSEKSRLNQQQNGKKTNSKAALSNVDGNSRPRADDKNAVQQASTDNLDLSNTLSIVSSKREENEIISLPKQQNSKLKKKNPKTDEYVNANQSNAEGHINAAYQSHDRSIEENDNESFDDEAISFTMHVGSNTKTQNASPPNPLQNSATKQSSNNHHQLHQHTKTSLASIPHHKSPRIPAFEKQNEQLQSSRNRQANQTVSCHGSITTSNRTHPDNNDQNLIQNLVKKLFDQANGTNNSKIRTSSKTTTSKLNNRELLMKLLLELFQLIHPGLIELKENIQSKEITEQVIDYTKLLREAKFKYDSKILSVPPLSVAKLRAMSNSSDREKHLAQVAQQLRGGKSGGSSENAGPPSLKRLALINYTCQLSIEPQFAQYLIEHLKLHREIMLQLKENNHVEVRCHLSLLLAILACHSPISGVELNVENRGTLGSGGSINMQSFGNEGLCDAAQWSVEFLRDNIRIPGRAKRFLIASAVQMCQRQLIVNSFKENPIMTSSRTNLVLLIQLMQRCLQDRNEDDYVKHVILSSLSILALPRYSAMLDQNNSNSSSQPMSFLSSGSFAHHHANTVSSPFCNPALFQQIWIVFKATKNELLRDGAIRALFQLSWLSPHAFLSLCDKTTGNTSSGSSVGLVGSTNNLLEMLIAGGASHLHQLSQISQTRLLSSICLSLLLHSESPAAKKLFADGSTFLSTIIKCLDNPSKPIRFQAWILFTIQVSSNADNSKLSGCFNHQFVALLERESRQIEPIINSSRTSNLQSVDSQNVALAIIGAQIIEQLSKHICGHIIPEILMESVKILDQVRGRTHPNPTQKKCLGKWLPQLQLLPNVLTSHQLRCQLFSDTSNTEKLLKYIGRLLDHARHEWSCALTKSSSSSVFRPNSQNSTTILAIFDVESLTNNLFHVITSMIGNSSNFVLEQISPCIVQYVLGPLIDMCRTDQLNSAANPATEETSTSANPLATNMELCQLNAFRILVEICQIFFSQTAEKSTRQVIILSDELIEKLRLLLFSQSEILLTQTNSFPILFVRLLNLYLRYNHRHQSSNNQKTDEDLEKLYSCGIHVFIAQALLEHQAQMSIKSASIEENSNDIDRDNGLAQNNLTTDCLRLMNWILMTTSTSCSSITAKSDSGSAAASEIDQISFVNSNFIQIQLISNMILELDIIAVLVAMFADSVKVYLHVERVTSQQDQCSINRDGMDFLFPCLKTLYLISKFVADVVRKTLQIRSKTGKNTNVSKNEKITQEAERFLVVARPFIDLINLLIFMLTNISVQNDELSRPVAESFAYSGFELTDQYRELILLLLNQIVSLYGGEHVQNVLCADNLSKITSALRLATPKECRLYLRIIKRLFATTTLSVSPSLPTAIKELRSVLLKIKSDGNFSQDGMALGFIAEILKFL